MPTPPARSRSASVPCGVSSPSTSPPRYGRANSLFSPMYDAITRRMRPAASSSPRPHPSTPQLFETTSRSLVPCASSARISTIGTPDRPNPPTASDAPSGMSATASAAVRYVLSIGLLGVGFLGEDLARDRESGVGGREAGVEGGVQDDLGDLGAVEPVATSGPHVHPDLSLMAAGDEAREGRDRALSPGERRPGPHLAPRVPGDEILERRGLGRRRRDGRIDVGVAEHGPAHRPAAGPCLRRPHRPER